jgi:hypothetical protein
MWKKETDILLVENALAQGHRICAGKGRFCWIERHRPKEQNSNEDSAQWKEKLCGAVSRLSSREIQK